MSTVTKAPTRTATREWMSVYEKHQIKLTPVEETWDPHHGKRKVPGTGRILVFDKWRCQLSPDDEALLEEHHPDLIATGKVAPTERFTGIPGSSGGPTVVNGAQATRSSVSNRAPREGWDQATTRQVQEWIDTKSVPNLEQAWNYEMGHLRRKMVVRALTDAMLGDDPKPEQAEEPEPIAASFSRALPEGGDL